MDDVTSLLDSLREAMNAKPTTLSIIAESIAYLLIDIGSSALGSEQPAPLTPERLKKIYDDHQELPTLASALILQGASMLGWLRDEELVQSTRITRRNGE